MQSHSYTEARPVAFFGLWADLIFGRGHGCYGHRSPDLHKKLKLNTPRLLPLTTVSH